VDDRKRVGIALGVLAAIVVLVLGVDAWQRARATPLEVEDITLVPGSIPIYVDGRLVAGFQPADLEKLEQASFVDAEEGKTQDGWLLRDVLNLYLDPAMLKPEAQVTVISSSRGKSAELTWAEVADPGNWVMFDLSGRGTLKLVSTLERLDVRDEWVQDVDKIEVTTR
jgi:hypothetical protein